MYDMCPFSNLMVNLFRLQKNTFDPLRSDLCCSAQFSSVLFRHTWRVVDNIVVDHHAWKRRRALAVS